MLPLPKRQLQRGSKVLVEYVALPSQMYERELYHCVKDSRWVVLTADGDIIGMDLSTPPLKRIVVKRDDLPRGYPDELLVEADLFENYLHITPGVRRAFDKQRLNRYLWCVR